MESSRMRSQLTGRRARAMFTPHQFSVIGRPRDLTGAIFRFFLTLKTKTSV
jgi:hypothetical protein